MSKPYVVGIDIGGTNTVFGIVDARGTVLASSSIKTQKHSKIEDYINELHEELTKLIETNDATDKIAGIGIGAPNANYFTGIISDGVNLPWPTPIPLADLVSEKFGIPVAITNDANAAAIGCQWSDGIWSRRFRRRIGPCNHEEKQRPYVRLR